ncbi:hypothetical protein BV25DRAFT_1842122 [Artomyces pyxidatus]|uniref:Uncharacterized protein n=1 Tax=Artomyces pyxidatus TaxID=48021 RepID=A0ACB8SJU4_9AGAM|nr:hypothetical protein BV25DRAFT_1842122 [Artomyces pyxidatus]
MTDLITFTDLPAQTLSLASLSELPYDILRDTFCHACLHGCAKKGVFSASTRLSHVCRWWRFTAIKTAPLWTCIYLDGDQTSNRDAQFSRMATQIARSSSLPLIVYLSFPHCVYQECDRTGFEHLDAIMAALHPALSRVERLYHISNDDRPARRLMLTLEDELRAMPLLKDLTVLANPILLDDTDLSTICCSRSTGALETLRLADTPLHWKSASLRNVTNLTLRFLEPGMKPELRYLQDALRSCSETLVYLELEGMIQYLEFHDEAPEVAIILTHPVTPTPLSAHAAVQATDYADGQELVAPDEGIVSAGGNQIEEAFSGDDVTDSDSPPDARAPQFNTLADAFPGSSAVIDALFTGDFEDDAAYSEEEEDYEMHEVGVPPLPAAHAIIFPHLIELRLGFSHPAEGVTLLKLVSAPNLRRLHFQDTRNMDGAYDEEHVEFFCNTALKYLVHHDPLPLAQLEHLQLEGIHYVSRFGQGMALLESCAALQTLRLARCHPSFYAPLVPCDHTVSGDQSYVLGFPHASLRRVHAGGRDLSVVLRPFQIYAEAAVSVGLPVAPYAELVIDYTANRYELPLATLLDLRPVLADTVVVRRFREDVEETRRGNDEDAFVSLQERALGLADEVAPEEVFTRTYSTAGRLGELETYSVMPYQSAPLRP